MFFVLQHHAFEQEADGALALFGFGDFGSRGEGAEFGVARYLFYDFDGLWLGVAVGGWFGEVEAGDLEAVEKEAGAAGVDVVGGDALEDLADGGLDGGAIFWQREGEGGASGAALAWVGDGFSGGVVVVTELFVAEALGWRSGVPSVKMLAALVLFWWLVWRLAWLGPLSRRMYAKVFQRKGPAAGLPRCRSGLNAKARLSPGLFCFLSTFNSIELSETKMPL